MTSLQCPHPVLQSSVTAASLQHHCSITTRPSCGDTVPSHRPLITLYPWVRVRSWVGCWGACLRQEMAFQFFKIILFHFEISYWHLIMQFKDIRMHKNQNFTQCHPFVTRHAAVCRETWTSGAGVGGTAVLQCCSGGDNLQCVHRLLWPLVTLGTSTSTCHIILSRHQTVATNWESFRI